MTRTTRTETSLGADAAGSVAPTQTTTTQTELHIGENQISGPVAGAVLIISELAFFFSFLLSNLALIWRALYLTRYPPSVAADVTASAATADALRDIALGSGVILAVIIVGQQVVTAILGRFLK